MANAKELAEKAFTLLQDALRDSESRVSELDAELKRKRPAKSRLEQRLDVLTHRLESVDAEAQKWKREHGLVEELLENERAKVQQLKKKLEVAESGPDKLTKKEINFWRQRAEHFDAETREYKQRIAALKQKIQNRESFDPSFGPDSVAEGDLVSALEAAREEVKSLREQLAAHEAELGDLRDTVDGTAESLERPLESAPDPDAARLAEEAVALRARADGLEHALGESQTERDALSTELERLRQELNDSRQTAGDAQAASERIAETMRDREAKLAELTAELEKTRALLGQRADGEAALRTEIERLEQSLAGRDDELLALSDETERLRGAESGRAEEIDRLRGHCEGQAHEIEQLRQAKERLQREISELLDRAEHSDENHRAELEELKRVLDEHREGAAAKDRELAEKRHELEDKDRALLELRDMLAQKEADIAQLESARSVLEHEKAALVQEQHDAREQFAGLEAELKEEKECTANLSELANERREELGRLQEKVEELEERYEEAKWRLGKAQHFERLVRRRKTLVGSLIEALRAKAKANAALKAGLDGLRTFKAAAEVQQQKLLVRIDKLNAELKDAEETIARHQGATLAGEQLAAANAKVAELQERLDTQIELIETLENDLKAAKASRQTRDDSAAELEQLRQALEAKNGVITQLEADVDEQQRKLAKLRGSESETMRLKALGQQDKSQIDALQREVAQLREALTRKAAESGDSKGDASGELRERDNAIARLMSTAKEQEAEIAKLKELAAQWKKKYEFLSTDAPDAYQNIVDK